MSGGPRSVEENGKRETAAGARLHAGPRFPSDIEHHKGSVSKLQVLINNLQLRLAGGLEGGCTLVRMARWIVLSERIGTMNTLLLVTAGVVAGAAAIGRISPS